MSLNISSETEARLTAKAQELNLSVEAFIEKLIGEESTVKISASNAKGSDLPVWDLQARGSLHRRDIYDDVR